MSRSKTHVEEIREQLAIEYFAGFDDLDELFERVAKMFNVDKSTIETLYNEMVPNEYL